jgi:hypothetical protein
MSTLVIDASNQLEHAGGFVGTGGFYVRPMTLRAGMSHAGHKHHIDHVGNLVSGHARVHWEDPRTGEAGVIDARVPCKLHIVAGRTHRIEAVTDVQWECWFAQAEADRIYGAGNDVPYYFEVTHG